MPWFADHPRGLTVEVTTGHHRSHNAVIGHLLTILGKVLVNVEAKVINLRSAAALQWLVTLPMNHQEWAFTCNEEKPRTPAIRKAEPCQGSVLVH